MKSVWRENSEMPSFPRLERDMKTDVLIVGGGIAGILCAYFLHKRGVKYALLEKDRICSGTTQNTTAKITFQHGLVYDKMIKDHGLGKTKGYLEANERAFEEFAKMCKNIDCDYEIKDNFVYSLRERAKLEREITALSKLGYNAELCEKPDIPLKTLGAVCFRDQAQFNPLKFLAFIAKGLNIYENTFVRNIEGNTAITDHGKIEARNIIVATHFPFIDRHGGYFLKLYQHRSYVIALENAADVRGMYVDEAENGMSFRNYQNLLLVSGGDHRTGKNGGNYTELRNFAKQYYPKALEKYFWSTQDCMSLDAIPYIGKYSKNTPNLYTASGFNKWGMTGSMLSAMMLSDMVCDRKNKYAEIFDPSRSILRPQLFVNGFETVKNLLTISEKRCSHLGCALKWNSAEHTWDCACHGSRFSKDGKVIDNPANRDLK